MDNTLETYLNETNIENSIINCQHTYNEILNCIESLTPYMLQNFSDSWNTLLENVKILKSIQDNTESMAQELNSVLGKIIKVDNDLNNIENTIFVNKLSTRIIALQDTLNKILHEINNIKSYIKTPDDFKHTHKYLSILPIPRLKPDEVQVTF